MNKKKPRKNQFRQLFNYLLDLGRITSEGHETMFRLIAINFSQKSPHFSLLSPTSSCELSEREVTSPSNLSSGSPEWTSTNIYGPQVFLLTKIKPEYSNILYNPTHFPGPLVCQIRQILLYIKKSVMQLIN